MERNVTRTVKETIYSVLCINVETAETSVIDFTATTPYKTEKDALKALKKAHETETFTLVAIKGTTVEEALYVMSEADFIANAVKCPPRKIG